MKSLHVFYEDQLVGELTRDDDLVFAFTYNSAWQQNPKAFPLSIAMPMEQRSYGNRLTLSFFENLLPEGNVKESLQRAHGITGVFDFLEHYGKDCAGAIIVTDQNDYKYRVDPGKSVPIDMEKVYAAIDEHNSVADIIAQTNPGYLSLAGAQDKFPAIYDEGRFLLPTHGAPTTHIVKAPIQHTGIKESVFNEYYCMELARAVDFSIPRCFVTKGKHPLFVIERYDRRYGDSGFVHRIHQQDFCQAQGKTSEFKYEDKGGPTLKENYHLILNTVPADKRVPSLQNFLNWLAFNLIIGNHDSHSKNISFLLHNSRNELAPFYDLICTAIYPRLKRQFSFKIGDRDEFSKIGANQLKQLEESLTLKEGTFRKCLADMASKLQQQKDTVANALLAHHPEAKIPLRISELIDERIDSLKRQKAM